MSGRREVAGTVVELRGLGGERGSGGGISRAAGICGGGRDVLRESRHRLSSHVDGLVSLQDGALHRCRALGLRCIPPVAGHPGRSRRRPQALLGDKGDDSDPNRRELRKRRIPPVISRRGASNTEGLGKLRYVVDQTSPSSISSNASPSAGNAAPTSTTPSSPSPARHRSSSPLRQSARRDVKACGASPSAVRRNSRHNGQSLVVRARRYTRRRVRRDGAGAVHNTLGSDGTRSRSAGQALGQALSSAGEKPACRILL